MAYSYASLESLQLAVSKKVCHHMDGIAIGTTAFALARERVLERLLGAEKPLRVSDLALQAGARPGYLHLALKLLEEQGFIRRWGDIPAGKVAVSLTEPGREWLKLAHAYECVPALIDRAMGLSGALSGQESFDAGEFEEHTRIPKTPLSEMGQRVRLHLQGHLISVAMKELAVLGIFDRFGAEAGTFVDMKALPWPEEPLAAAIDLLACQGWAVRDGYAAALTPEGTIARLAAPQYFYPVSYLPTLCRVPDLLFGTRTLGLSPDQKGIERHVDRALDIAFSGMIFKHACRDPFLGIVLPLFNHEPLKDQPACVLDCGSGDGTLLVELYRAICEGTLRGRMLHEYPLLMVGAEYNPLAREHTARRLGAENIPHFTLFGDIGNPEGLAVEISRKGMDPLRVLHVSKSVVHNRTYRSPRDMEAARTWMATSTAVFVAPDGGMIPAQDLERNLVEHFLDWRPWAKRHGMIAIEAHTVDPLVVARHIGRNIMTLLDATHGYSHQYPVEIEVFQRAFETAGYVSIARREMGQQMVGRPILSIDHLFPRDLK